MLQKLALGLLLCAGSVSASDWVLVGRDANGATYQSDRSSVKVLEGYKAAWTSVDQPGSSGAQAKRVLHLVYFDCDSRTAAMKSGIAYNQAGSVVRTETVAKDKLNWRRVAVGTAGEAHFRRICSAPLAPAVASR